MKSPFLSTLSFLAFFCFANQSSALAGHCESIPTQWERLSPGWGTSGTFRAPAQGNANAALTAVFRDIAGLFRHYRPSIYRGTVTRYRVVPGPESESATISFHLRKDLGLLAGVLEGDFNAEISTCYNPPNRTPASCVGPRIVVDTRGATGSLAGMVDALVVDFCLAPSARAPGAMEYTTVTHIGKGARFDARANWFFENQSALINAAALEAYGDYLNRATSTAPTAVASGDSSAQAIVR